MRLNNVSKVIVILAIIGILGYAATSFAGRGRVWGGGGTAADKVPVGLREGMVDKGIKAI